MTTSYYGPDYQSKLPRKYTWVGNRISQDDMAKLHKLKEKTKIPITIMVAEAVHRFVRKEVRNNG